MNLDLLLEMICLVADIKAPEGDSRTQGCRLRARSQARSRPRRGGHRAGAGRHSAPRTTATSSATPSARSAPCLTIAGAPSKKPGRRRRSKCSASKPCRTAGDTFLVVADRDKAKGIAQYRKMKEREAQLAKSSRVSLEGLAEQIRQAGVKDLPLIIKGDVHGSVRSAGRFAGHACRPRRCASRSSTPVSASITESDVLLATASNAIIIGFNVRPERKAAELAAAGRRRDPPALDHLRAAGRDAPGHAGTARTHVQGELHGPRGGASTSSAFPRWAPSPAAACRTA